MPEDKRWDLATYRLDRAENRRSDESFSADRHNDRRGLCSNYYGMYEETENKRKIEN